MVQVEDMQTYGHTEAFLDLLKQTNRPVGDAIAPKDFEERVPSDYPYVVLYADDTPWWRMTGPLNDFQADKDLLYTVISVGRTRAEAEAMAEHVRALIDIENLTVPGYKVNNFYLNQLGRARRDQDIRPNIWTVADSFAIKTTPAT